ncbi:MAG: amino acid permease [Spirochaetes bacterium GWF1_51_8]|nr:MAG: amino acid permease [Spirochaetes bacterium GWF1_51_8]
MGLIKRLTSLQVFGIATGAMISTGVFVLPAVVFRIAGPSILLAYLFAGFLMLPALFSQLELASAIPKAGGSYFFAERILGSGAGVFTGFANWFTISLKSAFALVGIGAFATLIFPGLTEWELKLIAAGFCVFFTVMNLISVKSTGWLQVVMVAIVLLILAQFVVFGFRAADLSHFAQVFNFKWDNVFLATGMVFISYGGLTNIANVAEEVKNPGKSLVRSTLLAFLIVEALYLAIVAILIGVLQPAEFESTLTPLTTAGLKFFPGSMLSGVEWVITAVAAILAFVTTANAGIMTASRNPLAMSRDNLLPGVFAKVVGKGKIPFVSVIVTSVFMLFIIFLLNLEQLAKVASLFMLLVFIMINFSVIIIRFTKLTNYKPTFKSPLFPVTQILGIGGYIFLIFEMGMEILGSALGFLALTFLWYYFYSKKRATRKSAFVHMVEGLVGSDLRSDDIALEDELLDIIIETREIKEDRFDQIVRDAPILDLNRTMTRGKLFELVSQIVSEKWGIDAELVKRKFETREEEASTLIYPGFAVPHAIPHIIIEGESRFEIIIVRDKHGIDWNDNGEVVYTAFFLVGSKDERNFHLRALMAIAQILQHPDFVKNWMDAKNEKDLRSLILLTERQRIV